jgi:hypothetical protein
MKGFFISFLALHRLSLLAAPNVATRAPLILSQPLPRGIPSVP